MALIAIRLIEVVDQKVNEVEFVSFTALEDYAGTMSGTVKDKDDKRLITNQLKESVQDKRKGVGQ